MIIQFYSLSSRAVFCPFCTLHYWPGDRLLNWEYPLCYEIPPQGVCPSNIERFMKATEAPTQSGAHGKTLLATQHWYSQDWNGDCQPKIQSRVSCNFYSAFRNCFRTCSPSSCLPPPSPRRTNRSHSPSPSPRSEPKGRCSSFPNTF